MDCEDFFDMDPFELAFALGMAETIADEEIARFQIEHEFQKDYDDYREKYPSIVPRFNFGVPMDWHEVNKDNPPMFESQAAYLQRHDLLSKYEQKRLTDGDFEPESCLKYAKTYEKQQKSE